jgi:Tol biopolymer transport system component
MSDASPPQPSLLKRIKKALPEYLFLFAVLAIIVGVLVIRHLRAKPTGTGHIVFAASASFFDTTYLYTLDTNNPETEGGKRVELTTSGYDYDPIWSPDGKLILFVSTRDTKDSGPDANRVLYLMNADGSNQHPVPIEGTFTSYAAWSPDSEKFVFAATIEEETDLFTINTDGKNLRRLTHNGVGKGQPSWSPDGDYIVYTSAQDGNTEIYIMEADGDDERRLTNEATSDFWPQWSPDGKYIAFFSDRSAFGEIHLIAVEDDYRISRLVRDQPAEDDLGLSFGFTWSPDSKLIAFTRSNADFGTNFTASLFVADVERRNTPRLLVEDASLAMPSWSLDGSQILFERQTENYGSELFSISPDGENLRQLTDNERTDERTPSWQP